MRNFLVPILELLKGKNAGFVLAVLCFVLSLLWVIFGPLNTIFIVGSTIAGYILGVAYFSDVEKFRELLDKLFPPGRFR